LAKKKSKKSRSAGFRLFGHAEHGVKFCSGSKANRRGSLGFLLWGFSLEIKANFTQYPERAILQGADQRHCV
jgi:hypothetical protein